MRVFSNGSAIGLGWAALIVGGLIFTARSAPAQGREFTFSRDFFLPYQGDTEIEARDHFYNSDKTFAQEFAVTYGITNNLAIEPGVDFVRVNGEDLKYEGFDGVLRYRFGKFQYDHILPALNAEYEKPKDGDSHGELKFISTIFFHDGSDLTVNFDVGQNLEGDDKSTDSEFTLGYLRPLGPVAESSGMDNRGRFEFPTGFRGGVEFVRDLRDSMHDMLLGPTIVYRANERFKVIGTYAFAINNRSENSDQFHFILEYGF